MTDDHRIRLTVNGTEHALGVEPRASLADVLRDDLGLTGTNVTCEQGICGVCTAIVDGQAVRTCLTLAVQADGTRVETVESLGSAQELSDLQQAFRDERGLQCGFCRPGFLMLLDVAPARGPGSGRPGSTNDHELEHLPVHRLSRNSPRGRAVARVRDARREQGANSTVQQ